MTYLSNRANNPGIGGGTGIRGAAPIGGCCLEGPGEARGEEMGCLTGEGECRGCLGDGMGGGGAGALCGDALAGESV